ncbi:MAG: carotenoid biosynthesis protein [Methanobacteriota archaeon]
MVTNLFEAAAILSCAVAMAHSYKSVRLKRTLVLFGLPFLAGWVMEAIYMWSLRGFFYPAGSYALWLPGGFPLAIACGWALAVYVGFSVMRRFRSFKLGVLAGAGIDAVLEPLALYFNLWIWTTSNPLQQITYFEAPLINALVWPLFVSVMLFAFRRPGRFKPLGNEWMLRPAAADQAAKVAWPS